MSKRISLLVALILISFIVTSGHTNTVTAKLEPDRLLSMACGGSILGASSPPEFVPELRAAAGNALAEQVTEARSENAILEIDSAVKWERAALGPNAECRAIGEILLPHIYLDPVREDNPFAGESGFASLASSVQSPNPTQSIELIRARMNTLVTICRSALFGGLATDVISRLESITNGGAASIECGNQELVFDGSNLATQQVIGDALTGAYVSQLASITLASDVQDDDMRGARVCEVFSQRLTDSAFSDQLRQAVAEAFVQGNAQSRFPPEFSYECIAENELVQQLETGDVIAEASVDLSAKSLAKGSISDEELISLTSNGESDEQQLAAALALGIRWALKFTISEAGGKIMINGEDAILATVGLSGHPLASAYILPIGQAWAGQSMDTAGHCIQVGGLADCILTHLDRTKAKPDSPAIRSLSINALAQTSLDTNFKIIADQDIRNFVLLNENAQGLDVAPLSKAPYGGRLKIVGGSGPETFMPIANLVDAGIDDLVFDQLLEHGLRKAEETALAEYYEISEDSQHVIFRMRQGVQWNDGQPFTAADVIFSFGVVFYCSKMVDWNSATSSLIPFVDAPNVNLFSVDGTCTGLPAFLSNTKFIAPGPNGIIDSTPTGNDSFFGSRILPAVAPLSIGEAGHNVLESQSLETTLAGDDELVDVDSDEVAVLWKTLRVKPESIGLGWRICCFPQHILGSSFEDAITANDPSIFLNRWSRAELEESPETYVGTGPFKAVDFDKSDGSGIVERNPYFWKADESGNRLPKLDFGQFLVFSSFEQILNGYLEGQLDLLVGVGANPSDLTLISRSSSERNFENFISNTPRVDGFGFFSLNSDIHLSDPEKEALGIAFRNPEVRRAISQSYDRKSEADHRSHGLNAPIVVGIGRPIERDIVAPACPIGLNFPELTEFCDAYEILEEQVAFNIESAVARLDQIGIVDRDGDGTRDIRAGFGFILPGLDGKLDSAPTGDDFILQGFEHSGLGFSDRDGDGMLDQDPGVIQPGPNGILDTVAAGDDVAEVTARDGSLSFDFHAPFATISHEVGIGVSLSPLPFFELLDKLVFSNPPLIDSGRLGITSSRIGSQLSSFWDSCASNHFHKYSDCTRPEAREPYQVRVDELHVLARQILDPEGRARIHAELQLLLTANVPWIPITASRNSGSVRRDRVNSPVGTVDSPRIAEFTFLLNPE